MDKLDSDEEWDEGSDHCEATGTPTETEEIKETIFSCREFA